jgi:hypothetical protein
MSLHRVTLFALAALFTAGISSAASACCGGWGAQAPVAYAPAPVTYGYSGCGGCGAPTAAAVYAEPVAPAPAPVAWSGGCSCACGGCRGFFLSYATPAAEPMPIAPAPIYVVNQGPDYTGPGIMVPYHTWTPAQSYVTPGAYPYMSGYGGYGYGYRHYGYRGYGYRGYGYGMHRVFAPRVRVAFHERVYVHTYYHRTMPVWHAGMHRYYR